MRRTQICVNCHVSLSHEGVALAGTQAVNAAGHSAMEPKTAPALSGKAAVSASSPLLLHVCL